MFLTIQLLLPFGFDHPTILTARWLDMNDVGSFGSQASSLYYRA
jgi:hypothetical protein